MSVRLILPATEARILPVMRGDGGVQFVVEGVSLP